MGLTSYINVSVASELGGRPSRQTWGQACRVIAFLALSGTCFLEPGLNVIFGNAAAGW